MTTTQRPAHPPTAHGITRVSLARVSGRHLSDAANEPKPVTRLTPAGAAMNWGDLGQLLVTTFGEPVVLLICALCLVVAAVLAVMTYREITEPLPPVTASKLHTANTPPTRRVRAGAPPPPLKPSYDGRVHETHTPHA